MAAFRGWGRRASRSLCEGGPGRVRPLDRLRFFLRPPLPNKDACSHGQENSISVPTHSGSKSPASAPKRCSPTCALSMPTLSRFFGIVITMNRNDHQPPHLHARYSEHEAVIRLDTLEVEAGRLPGVFWAWCSNGRRSTGPNFGPIGSACNPANPSSQSHPWNEELGHAAPKFNVSGNSHPNRGKQADRPRSTAQVR